MLVLLILSLVNLLGNSVVLSSPCSSLLENAAVDRFREYIRIDTSKEENLKLGVEFWIRQATEVGLPYAVYEPAGLPIFVATLEGSDPTLPSIMLNSHMDVVTADEQEWLYPPYDAHMDENGDIYGRGTQDTKDIAIQYMEAIRRLKDDNVTLARTIHFTVMPDEEVGGRNGIEAFVQTEEFKSLNVGFVLDEGAPSNDDFYLFAMYQDKRPWQMRIVIDGDGGHGSTFLGGSAMKNAFDFMTEAMAFRDTQLAIAATKPLYDASAYTVLNINVVHGGTVVNIIPSRITIEVDIRLAPDVDPVEMQSRVNSWLNAAGNNTAVTYLRQLNQSLPTAIDDSNLFWQSMNNTMTEIGIRLIPIVLPGTSDMTVIRNLGIPAIGFSPKINTALRVHAENEYLNANVFLGGIDIYTKLLQNLCNV